MVAQFYTLTGYKIQKYYNKHGALVWKRPEACLRKWVSEGLQVMSYCEVTDGQLSEIRWKAATLGVDVWLKTYTEVRQLVDGWGLCVFYVLLCNLIHLGLVFCFHLMFLADKTAHKKMQNSSYT